METREKTIEVLNDLIEINNDRSAGFEKAADNLDEQDYELKPLFRKLAGESRNNSAALTRMVSQQGGEPETGTSASGTLHRAWLSVEATFTGRDREAVLSECDRGEDAAKKAYSDAIEEDNELSPGIAGVLREQQELIIAGHDQIKTLRNKSQNNAENNFQSENKDNNFNNENGFRQENESDNKTSYNSTIMTENESGSGFDRENEFEEKDESETVFTNDNNFGDDNRTDKQQVNADDSKLKEFFVNELEDLLWAEKKLVETLPKMMDAAYSLQLRKAFSNHLAETEEHVNRLEQIFGIIGKDVDTTKCDAMAGIVEEGEEIISHTEEGTSQRDVGLIFAGQKAEHYEIASYGGMVSLAKNLGYSDAANILSQTLAEEKAADSLLTQIAENNINYQASTEPKDESVFS